MTEPTTKSLAQRAAENLGIDLAEARKPKELAVGLLLSHSPSEARVIIERFARDALVGNLIIGEAAAADFVARNLAVIDAAEAAAA